MGALDLAEWQEPDVGSSRVEHRCRFYPVPGGVVALDSCYGWGQLAVAAGIIYYLFTSTRVADTFADFPADSETGSGKA